MTFTQKSRICACFFALLCSNLCRSVFWHHVKCNPSYLRGFLFRIMRSFSTYKNSFSNSASSDNVTLLVSPHPSQRPR
ncbi:hypothetical protein BJ878DRAFT_227406 [Calycina marina]|uniref:Secreted protein n=1 Tax=Calycina marina TaxID=1763456 RepID=A0A9P8CCC5_9HELO|nr:hypothetical protein BJ878DRAFT_227406 [Calycina marina]